MPATKKTDPDAILAYVKVLRITDRLLDVADELRDARNRLEKAVQAQDKGDRVEAVTQ